jgi:enterochelin esterase family protein
MFKVVLFILCFSSYLLARVQHAGDVLSLYQKDQVTDVEQKELKEFIQIKYKKIDLSQAKHRPIIKYHGDGGGTVAWFMQAKSGSDVYIHAEKKRSWQMKEIGGTGLYYCAEKFPPMSAAHFRYTVNNYRFPVGSHNWLGFEKYEWGPMSLVKKDVPKGVLTHKGKYKATDEFYPGTERDWWIYVPAQYNKQHPAKLIVFQDGGGYTKGEGNATIVMDNLIAAKKMPVTIAVFVNPGIIPNKDPKKAPRKNRSNEYDTCTPKYATFIEKEILSQVYSEYNISRNPEDHAIAGASSGASCAFTAAWYRNDLFTRVISFIGSYCDFRNVLDYPDASDEKSEYGPWKVAHDYPALIRKTVPNKNIRIYIQDGENDLDNNLGNWFLNNLRMEAALAFAGYDYKSLWGKGRHSRRHGMSVLPEVLEWIWK